MNHQPLQPESNAVQGEPGSMILFDLRQLVRFREDRPYTQVLSDIGSARLILLAFKAGQELKEHRTPHQLIVQALRGRVTFTAVGNNTKLQSGMVLQLEANIPHSLVAQTDAIVLVTLIMDPSSHPESSEDEHVGGTPLVRRQSTHAKSQRNSMAP